MTGSTMQKGLLALVALSLFPMSAGEAFAARSVFVYHATEIETPHGAASMLVPEALTVSSDDPAALAQAVFDALAKGRPALYAGSAVKVAAGQVEIALADAALEAREVVTSELYWSLRAAGFVTIRAPRLSADELAADDAGIPVFRRVYAVWQVLPPSAPEQGLVRVGGDEYAPVADVVRRIEARDSGVMDRLRDLLRSGPEAAKLAIIRFYEEQNIAGRSGPYLFALKPSEPQAVKLALLQALSTVKSPKVLDAMAALAEGDTDPVVKSAAARFLVKGGRKQYEAYLLLEKLQSDDAGAVLAAVGELVKSGDVRVAGALASMLKHRDERVRTAALDGLVTLKAWDLLATATEDADVEKPLRLRVAEQLGGSGDRALAEKGLRYRLREGDAAQASAAAERLGADGVDGAVGDLVAALKHADPSVRHAAVHALGALKAQPALPALAEAAANAADREVVEPVIVAIVASMTLDQVIDLTSSDVTVLRKLSLRALAEFAKKSDKLPPRLLAVLKGRLSDPDPEIRRAAVYALARTGDAGVAADLMALADDSDAGIREQVVIAARLGKPAGAAELVQKKLKDPSDAVKLEAVRGVRELGVHDALAPLLWMVDYGKVDVKREVVRTVVALAQPSDHEKLFDVYVKLMFDMDKTVKIAALEGIAAIKTDPRTISQMGSLVRDPDAEVQVLALRLLGAAGDARAVEPIAGALMVGTKPVKLEALDALGKLGVEQGVKPIQEFLRNESDEELRTKAEQALELLPGS